MKYLTLLCCAVLGACWNTSPPPKPPPLMDTDAGQGPCAALCANLVALQCPEDPSTCPSLCVTIVTDVRFSPTQADAQAFLDCGTNAKTQADAQKCGPAVCR